MSDISSSQPSNITHRVTMANGQTADAFVVEKYDGTDVFKVDKDGYVTKQFDPDAVAYTVWKSGSTYYAKSGANGSVLTSGSNAVTVIQAAIDAMTNGGTLVIKSGTYTIDSQIECGSDKHITGEGWGTILQNASATDISTAILQIGDDCVVDNLQIDGQKSTITIDTAYKNLGIVIIGDRVTVHSCYIHDTYGDGIAASSQRDLIVRGNIIIDTGVDGSSYDGHACYFSYSESGVISGNILKPDSGFSVKLRGVSDTASDGYYSKGWAISDNYCTYRIVMAGTDDVTITGNVIDTCAYGIHLDADAASQKSRNVIISNNVYFGDGTSDQVVQIDAYNEGVIISDNILRNLGSGISCYADNAVIESNVIIDCATATNVIYVNGAKSCVRGNSIDGWLESTGIGIHIYSTASGSIVEGNRLRRDTQSSEGIRIAATGCLIYGNMINNAAYGIREATSGSAYNVFRDNVLTDCTEGIRLVASYATVDGNLINTATYGIREYNTPNYSVITANRLVSCTTAIAKVGANSRIQYNIGYTTENSGASTGTGAQQTIAHGLASTPNRVFLSESTTGGALAYQSAAADATNIYITATNTKTYQWKAEVV